MTHCEVPSRRKSFPALFFPASFPAALLLLLTAPVSGQNAAKAFPPGAYIIDMGQESQTVANGSKPYGLIYQLIIVEGGRSRHRRSAPRGFFRPHPQATDQLAPGDSGRSDRR